MKRFFLLAASLTTAAPLAAQGTRPVVPPAAMSAIRQQDLRRDLFTMAGDAMRGRALVRRRHRRVVQNLPRLRPQARRIDQTVAAHKHLVIGDR